MRTTGPIRRRPGPEAGFTLLEVLVAFVILAVALGVVLDLFSSSLDRGKTAEDHVMASLLAQSKLAALGVEAPFRLGESEGRFDEKYAWRSSVRLFEEEIAAEIPETLVAYHVTVTVYWRARDAVRQISLASLRVARSR